jgi:hypothetical protein
MGGAERVHNNARVDVLRHHPEDIRGADAAAAFTRLKMLDHARAIRELQGAARATEPMRLLDVLLQISLMRISYRTRVFIDLL